MKGFIKYVRGDKMNGALILNILEDISPYPQESLGFKDCIILLISYVGVWLRLNDEVGFVKLRLRYNNGSEG